MRRINLPLMLDTIFAGICAFLLFFTAVRFYTKSAITALIFGVIACILFGALGYIYISGKQNKKLLISRDDKNRKLLSLHLSLSSDGYIRKLIKNCLGEDAKISGKKVLVNGNAYFADFKMQPLSEDDVAKVIKYRFEGKKIIYCNKISTEAAVLCENFLIETKQINELYSELKEKNLLPEKYVYEGAVKVSPWKKIKARFNRKLCAPLFWSGAALLALSYFTFFPIYYIVSGGIMLILSATAIVVS